MLLEWFKVLLLLIEAGIMDYYFSISFPR